MEAGMKGFLTKPVDREQLAHVIERCLAAKAKRHAQPPSPAPSATDVDALAGLRQIVGGDEPALLHELLMSYLQDAPTLVEAMRDALAAATSTAWSGARTR